MRFFFGHSSENEKIVPEALTDALEESNLHITRQVSRGQNSKYQVIFDQESHNVLISAKWIILRKSTGGCMEERENKREETASDAELQRLVEDFITQKQVLLIQVKKGVLGKEEFLQEAGKHIDQYYHFPATKRKRLLKSFEQYIFGYSRLSPLMDDKSISDIRVVSHDCIRIKREGKRMDAGISFASEKEYRQFIDYVATRNQVNISNLNAIQRFTYT